jgi:hypothetical protein
MKICADNFNEPTLPIALGYPAKKTLLSAPKYLIDNWL